MKPLLVGEFNPYGSDDAMALYPLPLRASGDNLCTRIMGLRRGEYLSAFDRVNLCTGKWSAPKARAKAAAILRERVGGPAIVLLGAKVSAAFGVDFRPFTAVDIVSTQLSLLGLSTHLQRAVVLPHPSGLSRLWNEPGAYERAREVLRKNGVLYGS